jgi:hypothetical protein
VGHVHLIGFGDRRKPDNFPFFLPENAISPTADPLLDGVTGRQTGTSVIPSAAAASVEQSAASNR